jgi:purine-binding chemotaxis protein CheW
MNDIPHRQFVTFALNGECYAIDILSVREIRAKSMPTHVPNSHPHVVGVINLRGAIIPVIDLRVAFGLRPVAVADGNAIVITATKWSSRR